MFFEYIYFRDIAPFLVLWMALMVTSASLKKRYSFLYPTLIVFLLIHAQSSYQSIVFEKNIRLFKQDKKLECRVAKEKYLVQKSDNYSLEKHYFTKDGVLIYVVDCEEF